MNEAIKVMEDKGAKIVYINDFYSSYYYNLNNNTKLHILLCYDFNKYIKIQLVKSKVLMIYLMMVDLFKN